jgi:ribonuclease VapC
MIIDSSALVAILASEPEREPFLLLMAQATTRRIGLASLLETTIVLIRLLGPKSSTLLEEFLSLAGIEIVHSPQPRPVWPSRLTGASAKEWETRPN